MRENTESNNYRFGHEDEKDAVPAHNIEERYDQLLAERGELSSKLENYGPHLFDIIVSPEHIDNEELSRIVDLWKQKVKKESSFFSSTDSLGIEIFKEDLENQPAFPGETIVFESKKLMESNLRNLKGGAGGAAGGVAYRFEPLIEILHPKAGLREQLFTFMSHGRLPESVSTLIHELIHRYHENKPERYINTFHTEAQAHFSGLIAGDSQDSITKIAQTLTEKKENGGVYELNHDQVIDALRTVSGLYALGKSDKEIADLIARPAYMKKYKVAYPVEEEFAKVKEKEGVDELDMQALDDIFRLHVRNERSKAQLLLYQTLEQNISPQTIKEFKIEAIKTGLGTPTYWQNGKKVASQEMLQIVACPVDEEFPYDLKGKRTGIIFGYFMDSESREKTYGIGRWEARGKESRLDLADTKEEQVYFLNRLRSHAERINLKSKEALFHGYVNSGLSTIDPLAREVLKAVISKDEAMEIYQKNLPKLKEVLGVIEAEIGSVGKLPDAKREAYRQIVKNYEDPASLFGLKLRNIDLGFARKLKRINRKLSN